jgi:hypothetical protein
MSGAAGVMNEPASPAVTRESSAFLPKEHGSWSLALEPLALGLLVAPSLGGAALALAAISGFFARRPAKAVLVPGSIARPGAPVAFALLTLCAASGLIEAALLGGFRSLWALLLAAPFGVLFLFFDFRQEARAVAAELAGASAFSLLPAALASLAGWNPRSALALAAVMCARSVPTVIALRCAVRIGKGRAAGRLAPAAAASAALALLIALAWLSLAPWVPAGLAMLLVVRWMVLARLRPAALTARALGMTEAAIGVVYVAGAALAYRL